MCPLFQFGADIGAEGGWIKHTTCHETCPEDCSNAWQYWDDDVKKWHTDSHIIISVEIPSDGKLMCVF